MIVIVLPPSASFYDVARDNALRVAEEMGIQITSVDNGPG